jgi:peptidoglycan hydrolase CwlO-like protein
MLGITIDTFPTYRQLKSAGFTEVQAEVLIESFRNLNEELAKGFVTKEEFNTAIDELKAQIQEIRAELKSEISDVKSELKSEILQLRNEIATNKLELNSKTDLLGKELAIKIGYMLAASIGLIVVLTKLV